MNRGRLLRKYIGSTFEPKLLDLFPNPAFAISLQLLKTGIAHVIRARRLSDSDERNFSALQVLSGAVDNWAGGDWFIVRFFSQGGLNDAIESVASSQMQGVNILGRKAAKMTNGLSYQSLTQNPFNHSTGSSSFFVFQDDLTLNSRIRFFSNAPNLFLSQLDNVSNRQRVGVQSGVTVNTANGVYGSGVTLLTINIKQNAGLEVRINGQQVYDDSVSVFTNNQITALFNNITPDANFFEAIVFAQEMGADVVNIEQNIKQRYGIA